MGPFTAAVPLVTLRPMGRRAASVSPARAKSRSDTSRPSVGDDAEAIIRAYLRLLVEAPLRRSDDRDEFEEAFVAVAAAWSETAGVDRRTLREFGVPTRILNRAGLGVEAAAETVRRNYPAEPFTVSSLVGRTGISEATVRRTILDDEDAGTVERVDSEGRRLSYRVVR